MDVVIALWLRRLRRRAPWAVELRIAGRMVAHTGFEPVLPP